MSRLVLIRHGESVWNRLNLFTGWVDVPLSPKGIQEALEAGKKLKDVPVDRIFVSSLIRAQMTAFLAMAEHGSGKVPILLHEGEGKQGEWSTIHGEDAARTMIPVTRAWELNERMYGELQGLDKKATAKKYGDDQVHIWRRSYDVPPPRGESLEMTAARTLPYFESTIRPLVMKGQNVLVSAHGNSLRAIIMKLDDLSKDEVPGLELATGKPIFYRVIDGTLKRDEG